jgi:hypothetical protein
MIKGLNMRAKNLVLIGLLSLLFFVPTTSQLEANFVQCPGGPCDDAEGTTINADVINGTPLTDAIDAQGGDDVVFGGAGTDGIDGRAGDDLLFGGQDSDEIEGGGGNDIILPGPDDSEFHQYIEMNDGNDVVNVLVTEITTCLFILDGDGFDVVNLVGFGPYSAALPFGQPGFGIGYVYVVDPITGGEIFIWVSENTEDSIDVINGLPSPNVTILPFSSPQEDACPPAPVI